MCKSYLWLILFALSGHLALAQQEDDQKQKFPLSVSITNHSWAFPFSSVLRLNPIYPGIAVGNEFHYKKGKYIKVYQTLDCGGLINQSSGSAIYVNSNIGLRGLTKFGLVGDLAFGLGYFHSYRPSNIYSQNASGQYELTKDKGIGALSSNLKLGLGYRIQHSNRALTPFIAYQWIASTAYWSIITIRPNGMLHFGVRWNLV